MEWRVFFIGPMPNAGSRDDGPESLRAYFVDHLTRACGFTELKKDKTPSVVLQDAKGEETVVAITPTEWDYSRGEISKNVFHQIDTADLIVADLRGSRPSVVYELAMVHALGIDVILVGDKKEPPFYLKNSQFNKIGKTLDYDQAGSDHLNRHFNTWLENKTKLRDSGNPFKTFYESALVPSAPKAASP